MEVVLTVLAGFMIALLILGIVISPFMIGKPRQPLTPAVAVTSAIFNYIIVMLLFWAYLNA